jgi:hypothetical protein
MTLPKHYGGGMFFVPELQLRKVLIDGLVDLAGDDERMDILFGRVDDLLGGTQDDWVSEMKDAFRAMATTTTRLRVLVGYPPDHAFLPCYSIVESNGSEQSQGTTHADIWKLDVEKEGVVNEKDLTGEITEYPRLVQTTTIATPWSSTVQIGSWAISPEGSVVLQAVARAILDKDKGRLHKAGVHNIALSTPGGFQPDPNRYPTVGYVPIISVALDWSCIQQTRQGPKPGRIASITTTPGN